MSSIIEKIINSAPDKRAMTASDFFIENNPNGYCSKNGYSALMHVMDERALKRQEIVHEYLADGQKNDGIPISYLDEKSGNSIVWTTFSLGGSDQKIPYTVTERMVNFIKDCQQRKINPTFTFDELYQAALEG